MGEIAEMMLEGIMCEGCGEYMGAGAGHPQRCAGCGGGLKLSAPNRSPGFRRMVRQNRERHLIARESKPFECHCHRLFTSQVALEQHQRDRHPGVGNAKKKFVCDCGSVFRTSAAMAQHASDKHGPKIGRVL